jgi:hypothetical protein
MHSLPITASAAAKKVTTTNHHFSTEADDDSLDILSDTTTTTAVSLLVHPDFLNDAGYSFACQVQGRLGWMRGPRFYSSW